MEQQDGAKKETYKDGQTIIKAGEKYQRIYQILGGSCKVEVIRDGQRVELNVMGEGEIFGEMSFVTGAVGDRGERC